MRRRYKALIAIFVPVVIVWLLKYIHLISYEWLMGYMFAVVLIFKGSILSLWFASKLKIIAFLKGLTFVKALILIVKRWFMDSVLMVWVKEHIIDHLTEGLGEAKAFYIRLNLKAKIRNLFMIVFGILVFAWGVHFIGYLDNLFLFAELKLIIESILKGFLLFSTKLFTWIFAWFTSSWLAPIVQVFALSYLLGLLEKWFGVNNPLSRFFNFIGDKLNILFYYIGILKTKHIDPMVSCKVVESSKKIGEGISKIIQNKKIAEEYRYFEKFEISIMKGHINAYHSFKGMEDIKDKKELYTIINQRTADNIDIVGFVSRNSMGVLLEEGVEDTFYHDIFLLEGFASCHKHGVKIQNEDTIDHSDFWVLNTSKFPINIGSLRDNFELECIPPNGIKFIKTKEAFDYEDRDVYCEYEGVRVAVTPISYS